MLCDFIILSISFAFVRVVVRMATASYMKKDIWGSLFQRSSVHRGWNTVEKAPFIATGR